MKNIHQDPDYPDAYKEGLIFFYGLEFKVTQDVLIPRPETELLIKEVLNLQPHPLTIIEVGTGSGCIAVTLAKHIQNISITAIDISEKALKIAEENANLHKVNNKIVFLKNDVLENINNKVDLVVANLPYIPSHKVPNLDRSVKDFEPHIALDGGYDGFELYRKMFNQIKNQNLNPKYILCEIDDDHEKIALEEAKKIFHDAQIVVKKDYSGFDRILLIDCTNEKLLSQI